MTSSRVANDLAAILVPIGIAGAVIAGLCALVAAVAIMRGAGGLAGGAVGVWIPAALLSSTAGFANQWLPLIVSGSALVTMLVGGAIARAVINATEPARAARRQAAADAADAAPEATRPAGVAVKTGAVPNTGGLPTTGTGAVPTLGRSQPAHAA